MSMYQVIKQGNQTKLRKLPDKSRGEILKMSNEELAKQRTYPTSGMDHLPDGQLLEDKEVEIREILNNKTIGQWSLNAMGPELVAFLLTQPKESEDELWSEFLRFYSTNGLQLHSIQYTINSLKQHYSITRK